MKVQGGYTGGGGDRPPVPTTGSAVKRPRVLPEDYGHPALNIPMPKVVQATGKQRAFYGRVSQMLQGGVDNCSPQTIVVCRDDNIYREVCTFNSERGVWTYIREAELQVVLKALMEADGREAAARSSPG